MEAVLIILPLALLLLAASILVVSQVGAFFAFGRYRRREASNRRAVDDFMRQMGLARTELSRRGLQLERLARDLKLSNDELTRMNEMKSRFLSMVTHDIRNPLSAIGGFSEMLRRRGGFNPDQNKLLGNITSAARQINHLVGDLTDLAVIEAGKLRMVHDAFDLGAMVGGVAANIGVIAAKKGVAFAAFEPSPGMMIVGDSHRIGQVLTNLLGNAVKFTPTGGRVEFHADLWAGRVVFSIMDTGPGIHLSERRKIFQKFYQSRRSKDAARSLGWGLGLSISEEIVRAHGGEIGVNSAGLGKGSTFWVKLPLTPPRVIARTRLGFSAARAMVLALLCAAGASAQTIPLEDKARFEASLEKRVEGVLSRILGPNRSKVVVDASVDFTRIERFETKAGTSTLSMARNPSYLWTAEESASEAELLPGVPQESRGPNSAASAKPQSYERQYTYPVNFIKRLSVTLILDRSVTAAQSAELRTIVSELLDLLPARGDSLTLVSTAFAPTWKTVWYSPETSGLMIKYVLISLLSLLSILVVAACFLKLAGAMNAMAQSQSQQIAMEMKRVGGMDGAEGGLLGLDDPKDEKSGDDEDEAGAVNPDVVIEVPLSQVETLCEMVRNEAPADMALLASRLKPEVRQRFLETLPRVLSDSVLASMGRVRFVDPEDLLNLKAELERRLSGAVGGVKYLLELVESSDHAQRRKLLDDLGQRDPTLAQEIRSRVFLIEDLAGLTPAEWQTLGPRVRHEEWAAIIPDAPAAVAEGLKVNMPEGVWRVIGQMAAVSTHSAEDRRRAHEALEHAVRELSGAGRIGDLAARRPVEPEALMPEIVSAGPSDGGLVA